MERAPSGLLKQGNTEAFHRKIKNNAEYLTTLSNTLNIRRVIEMKKNDQDDKEWIKMDKSETINPRRGRGLLLLS